MHLVLEGLEEVHIQVGFVRVSPCRGTRERLREGGSGGGNGEVGQWVEVVDVQIEHGTYGCVVQPTDEGEIF